jgi:hypothetical protein
VRRPALSRAALGVALAASLSLVGGACNNGSSAAAAASTKTIRQLPADVVPSELLGLKSSQEDM